MLGSEVLRIFLEKKKFNIKSNLRNFKEKKNLKLKIRMKSISLSLIS